MKTEQVMNATEDKDKKVEETESKKIEDDELDYTYRQLNTVSFQRNFKVLIGHYKINEHSPRAG